MMTKGEINDILDLAQTSLVVDEIKLNNTNL